MQVASTVRHPEYNDGITTGNDIMLVFLEEPADEGVDQAELL